MILTYKHLRDSALWSTVLCVLYSNFPFGALFPSFALAALQLHFHSLRSFFFDLLLSAVPIFICFLFAASLVPFGPSFLFAFSSLFFCLLFCLLAAISLLLSFSHPLPLLCSFLLYFFLFFPNDAHTPFLDPLLSLSFLCSQLSLSVPSIFRKPNFPPLALSFLLFSFSTVAFFSFLFNSPLSVFFVFQTLFLPFSLLSFFSVLSSPSSSLQSFFYFSFPPPL